MKLNWYYRPNENSTEQFKNFASTVKLEKGDFPPILDIERKGKNNKSKLRKEILNWLKLAEKEYGVKPIVYTGRTFYNNNLRGYIDDYPLWISSFSSKHKLNNIDWKFHQFTDKVRVKGIRSKVDGNDFNGDLKDLEMMLME